ncbi:DUF2865 domain-containing protein [Hyphomicrobium sp. LHD-15]|uniref:DUF2865 domain-containing protein n=1 Tax=Hyphomicrobium sp. LHD-15 TaxID=3072142 RepID=UPI002810112B|nr:DUF2865 domain-containing protein [Hyphomicrobium sp. LHD-15]MDQ8700258.1 DUF2865 domain-containing protein [Hyphomicrobium sp. LHD-15]
MEGSKNSGRGRAVFSFATKVDKRTAYAALAGILLAGSVAVPALAQSWWPFNDNQPQQRQAPVPREPVYQDPAQQAPPPQAQGNWSGGNRSPICLQLEQRLVQEGQRGSESRNLIPMVENELRQTEQTYRGHKQQLDRSDCYEYFLFSKTLRRTRRCVDLANQADATRQRIEDLEVQLQQLQGSSSGRSYQDEIVRELARNNCGANYQQQARKQSGGGLSAFWEDEESSSGGGGSGFGSLPYATYRTVCVRLCDGYYFPVSFSTLPNHFQRDEEVCQSKCAAPAELYYHQNPGAGMEQAVAARSNVQYTQLKTAFRYRKEYVQGCSCKMAEYTPPPGSPVPGATGDAGGWVSQSPTGANPAAQPPPAQAPQGSGETLPWSTTPQ